MTSNLIDNIYKIFLDKITKSKGKKYKCLSSQFHECDSFCSSCKNFICNNCIKKHDNTHDIIIFDTKLNELKTKIDSYKELSFLAENIKNGNNSKMELNENITKNAIQKIDELIKNLKEIKKKIIKAFELRFFLIKAYNKETKEINCDKNKFEFDNIKEEELKNLFNNINKTIEIKDIGKYMLDFYKLLDNSNKKNEQILSLSQYEKNNRRTNELNKILGDEVYKLFEINYNFFPLIEKTMNDTESIFIKEVCNNLKISQNEYNNQKKIQNNKIDNDFMKIENENINLIKSQSINNGNVNNLQDNNKININIGENPTVKIFEKSNNKIIEEPAVKIIEKIVEKPVENIKEKIITKYKFFDSQLILSSNVSSLFIKNSYGEEYENINNNKEENSNDSESKEDEEEENKNEIKNENIPNNNINNSSTKEEKSNSIFLDSFEVFTNDNCYEIINDVMEKGFFNKIKTIKELELEERVKISETKNGIEKESEIEKYEKTCQKKIKSLKKKINIFSTPKNIRLEEINIFTQNEQNLLEIVSLKGESIHIFNPYVNEVEEFLVPKKYKFPINFSFLNILPYCYVSGGIKTEENGEKMELSDFYAIRRRATKSFEFINLPSMIESKSCHCMVELKYLNGLAVIGGTDSKECEVFTFKKKEWFNLPDLNNIREYPCCCVLNERNLYCFFGYDNKSYKYIPSIEKISLDSKDKWIEINYEAQQMHMKRKNSSCLHYNSKGKEIVLIVGGINSLQNESTDYLIFNEKENKIVRKNNKLPFKCSFKQNSFTYLCSGYYCNFTSDSLIIQYDPILDAFFGIRES